MALDDLKTEHEVARILGLSVRTLQAKRAQDPDWLPYVKFGRAVRYCVSDIRSVIEKHRVVTADDTAALANVSQVMK